jgi:excisionase family DNA binding protein
MSANNDVLTVRETAHELRCSLAHVYNLINGKVRGVRALPVIPVGRRRLVRRSTLEDWKRENERVLPGGILPSSPNVDAVDA